MIAADLSGNQSIVSGEVTIEELPAGIVIAESGGSTVVSESGTTDEFTVALTSAPASNVVLTVTSQDEGEVTASVSQLTFTPANWSEPQSVVLTGVNDDDVDGTQTTNVVVSVDVASSDSSYATVDDSTVVVSTEDDDQPMLLFDFGTASSPLEDGYVRVSPADQYSSEVGYGWDGSVDSRDRGGSSSSLERDFVFTASNADFLVDLPDGEYDVEVRMGDAVRGHSDMQLSLEGQVVDVVTTTTGMYHVETYRVSVTGGQLTVGIQQLSQVVVINSLRVSAAGSSAGISISETGDSTVVSESGTTDEFTVALTSAPASNVVLTVTSQDEGEVTASVSQLTFTPANWSEPQSVVLTGVNDDDVDGTQTTNVVVSVDVASSDSSYATVDDSTVVVSTEDDDQPMLLFDFGTASSPLEDGYVRVSPADQYSSEVGYGWDGSVDSRDRGGSSSSLERDFVFTASNADFLVDLPDGEYDVEVRMGDAVRGHSDMQLSLEGQVVDVVTTTTGMYHVETYRVSVTGGQLTVRIQQLSQVVVINSLRISSVAQGSAAWSPGDSEAEFTQAVEDRVASPIAAFAGENGDDVEQVAPHHEQERSGAWRELIRSESVGSDGDEAIDLIFSDFLDGPWNW